MVKWEREAIAGTELDGLQGPFQLNYTLILRRNEKCQPQQSLEE